MLGDLSTSDLAIIFVSLVISITLHEAMHAFTGFWLGDDTAKREGRITLNPLKHIDPFATLILPIITLVVFKTPLLAAKPVPFNPNRVKFEEYGAALVGIAGPLTNLLLAIIGAGFLHVFFSNLSAQVIHASLLFVEVNIGLFVFNMLPIPPLDGSRLLYAFAPEVLQNIMAQIEQFGIFIIFALILAVPQFGDILVSLNNFLLKLLF